MLEGAVVEIEQEHKSSEEVESKENFPFLRVWNEEDIGEDKELHDLFRAFEFRRIYKKLKALREGTREETGYSTKGFVLYPTWINVRLPNKTFPPSPRMWLIGKVNSNLPQLCIASCKVDTFHMSSQEKLQGKRKEGRRES